MTTRKGEHKYNYQELHQLDLGPKIFVSTSPGPQLLKRGNLIMIKLNTDTKLTQTDLMEVKEQIRKHKTYTGGIVEDSDGPNM